ncbi:MAG: regulatory protein RecX [Vicinamibacterales bacterium]
MDDSARDAYVAGLKLLARRELSEKQVRERLRRKEYENDDIDSAIARLKSDRALDDTRFAHALARHEISTKRHGRLRAQRQLESAGVPPPLARAALDEALGQVDQDALIESALSRRLRGDATIDDEAQFRRLYRFLIGQGFDSERALRVLKRHRPLK